MNNAIIEIYDALDEKIYGLSKVEEHSSKVERVPGTHPDSRQRKGKYSEVWRIDLETLTDHYLGGILKEEYPWDSPGKNTGVGYYFLLQGIFPTQRLSPDLLY